MYIVQRPNFPGKKCKRQVRSIFYFSLLTLSLYTSNAAAQDTENYGAVWTEIGVTKVLPYDLSLDAGVGISWANTSSSALDIRSLSDTIGIGRKLTTTAMAFSTATILTRATGHSATAYPSTSLPTNAFGRRSAYHSASAISLHIRQRATSHASGNATHRSTQMETSQASTKSLNCPSTRPPGTATYCAHA